jgi:hypothetical protein
VLDRESKGLGRELTAFVFEMMIQGVPDFGRDRVALLFQRAEDCRVRVGFNKLIDGLKSANPTVRLQIRFRQTLVHLSARGLALRGKVTATAHC